MADQQAAAPSCTATGTAGRHPATTAAPAHRAPYRAGEPRPVPAPPRVPRDPAATDHRWPDLWPLRSYLELAALSTAAGSARAHASAVLWEWNLSAISDDCTLIVSEMITNAVHSTQAHHRPDPVRLWMLGTTGTAALFLIWDATRPAPVRRVATPDALHGRGLGIVDALSARWGYYHPAGHPGGKVRHETETGK